MTSQSPDYDKWGPLPWGRSSCPECNGTGFVFALDERDPVPLKARGGQWGKPRRMPCGYCGGDGRIDPDDFPRREGDITPGEGKERHPIDLYTEMKKRYADDGGREK